MINPKKLAVATIIIAAGLGLSACGSERLEQAKQAQQQVDRAERLIEQKRKQILRNSPAWRERMRELNRVSPGAVVDVFPDNPTGPPDSISAGRDRLDVYRQRQRELRERLNQENGGARDGGGISDSGGSISDTGGSITN